MRETDVTLLSEVRAMTRKAPFHSEKPGDSVYHNNDQCEEAKKVEPFYRAEGTAGRPLCKTCAALDRRLG
jgi:hypothetical protein